MLKSSYEELNSTHNKDLLRLAKTLVSVKNEFTIFKVCFLQHFEQHNYYIIFLSPYYIFFCFYVMVMTRQFCELNEQSHLSLNSMNSLNCSWISLVLEFFLRKLYFFTLVFLNFSNVVDYLVFNNYIINKINK